MIVYFAPECETADPNQRNFDVLDLSDAVDNCVAKMNGLKGWQIFGWLKPTEIALAATKYDYDVHVVCVRPLVPAEAQQVSAFFHIFTPTDNCVSKT